jgi:sugar lactone lactonase YvrE
MGTTELDKETYRSIVQNYFRAFETSDFSQVQFSSQIQFLSPISGITMNGRDEVGRFVTGVSTRVTLVNIISTAIDFPTASGVWQMTTTKGVQYTLHNFFRLDGEGIAYIWPMFDPKAVMDNPTGLLQWLRGEGYYDIAAQTQKQPAGVTISKTGRMFVNFPRWVDEPTPSVAEIGPDGVLIPYPNEAINAWDKAPGMSAQDHFVCVQSVLVDEDDHLWILDPASPMFQGVIESGSKLLKVNLKTNAVEQKYHFDTIAAPEKSYLNDVRFAHGHAFMSDSGLGAIVVLDLATGTVRRLLENHASTKAESGVQPVIGARPWKFEDNTTPQVHSDGIAIDPKHEYVYYKALVGRSLYRVPVAALLDESLTESLLERAVELVAVTEPTDGLEFDKQGNLYMTSLEWNAIKVLRTDGRIEVLARATDFLWPDTIAMSNEGELLFTATQFHLMPAFNNNIDKRTPPYKIFRLKTT